jgi:protocatechuate 3,4-dioxygenase alpha subunit
MSFPPTPSQTVGPFFAIGLPWKGGRFAVDPATSGAITITGTVFDGAQEPIPDSLVETWQADPEGRFADLHGYGGPSGVPGFRGFARYGAEDGDGSFEIVTLKPGPVAGPDGMLQAPHIDVSVFARGMLHRCVTRIYFADEPDANEADPVLSAVPRHRRDTLLAEPASAGYRFDIHLQGPRETIFFAV